MKTVEEARFKEEDRLGSHVGNIGIIRDTISRRGAVTGLIMLSGSDMYGFSSSNSDYDYRGFYIYRTGKIFDIKYAPHHDHIEVSLAESGMDGSFMEIKKFMGLALNMNCNVLEHLFGPPLVNTTEAIELRNIIKDSFSKEGLYNSYKGMALFNYKKFIFTGHKKTVKKYLYVFRALMAGIHAMTKGFIEPNICNLNKEFNDPIVASLIEDKIRGLEDDLANKKYDGVDDRIDKYKTELDEAYQESDLPKMATDDYYEVANNFLKRVRQRYWDMVSLERYE